MVCKVKSVIKYLLITYSLGISMLPALSQSSPPQLKNKKYPGMSFYAGFRQKKDSATVVTVKFKLTETGFLDTLSVSSNAPKDYYENLKKQLVEQNGKWKPQYTDGKSVPSKWLVYRHYVMGPDSPSPSGRWKAIDEAYQRDYDLFRCLHKGLKPIDCLTPYIEGPDFFLFPPERYPTFN
ncbi:hypothetical protein G8759_25735 [Spirosoma aureum]|uniref:TonB C-terminal domain-containing protein n=1 Tax=Spirosoma aureum TaxID=2692134 RepID=A0A6G9ATS5_9BACT|nr:hypothetical protein [Spirosoma aureum]QIP15788.1 hypothetical protein G8759_25735 [Spirosoma aureum]